MTSDRIDRIPSGKKYTRDLLGSQWTYRIIDYELCVYRDLGNFDVEISGGRTRRSLINIYVWQTKPHYSIVERHFNLRHGRDDIRALCEDIVSRYSGREGSWDA